MADSQGTPTFASELGEWVADLKFEDLPPEIVEIAKDSLVDTVSCGILGASRPRTKVFTSIVKQAPGGEGTVFLAPWRTSAVSAALINSIYAHSCELDDSVGRGGGGHGGVVVVPVTLALGEQLHLSGREVITGIVAGYEVMHRAIAAIFPSSNKRGFQSTGLVGSFGATAAAAKLMGLPAETIAQAFGIAGNSSSGLSEYDQSGGESKRLYAGFGARAGIEAAQLAESGVTGPLTIFEGKRGLWNGFSPDHVESEKSTSNLGKEFRIDRRICKDYPAIGGVHGAIQAAEVLCPTPLKESQIKAILVNVPPEVVHHGGSIKVPHDFMTAQFSLAFSVALRILYGRNDIELYEDEEIRSNPDLIKLCEKVTVEAHPKGSVHENSKAFMTLELADGTVTTYAQNTRRGSSEDPLTSADFRERFYRFTHTSLEPATQDALADAMTHFERLENLDEFFSLLGSR